MRRIISLLLLIATIVVMPTMLTSCGDDEPDTPATPNPGDHDASKLYGTWVGKDYDETYTITFYSDGKAKEVWTDGYDSETLNGTYVFSNGKITSWNMSNGSILANVLGDCPWPVTFNSANSITLGSGYNKMTLTKK